MDENQLDPQSMSAAPIGEHHSHAAVWFLGVLTMALIVFIVAAGIWLVQRRGDIADRADQAQNRIAELEQELETVRSRVEGVMVSEDSFIAYGGEIVTREREEFEGTEAFQAGSKTYLSEQDFGDSDCTWIPDLGASYNIYDPNPTRWADPAFLASVQSELSALAYPERAVNNLIEMDAAGRIPNQICHTDDRIYTTAIGDGYGYVDYWSNEAGYATEYQPIRGVIGDGFNVLPDALNGYTIVSSGYGDAGRSFYHMYVLDPSTLAATMIESCDGGYNFDESTDAMQVFDYACPLEYRPLNEE